MQRKYLYKFLLFLFATTMISQHAAAYPIDGYDHTGIERLLYHYRNYTDSTATTRLDSGAMLMLDDIRLSLEEGVGAWPDKDENLMTSLRSVFRYLEPQYSISVMDITDPDNLRYAGLREEVGYQPGSVAKIIAAVTLFHSLHGIYGDDWEAIHEVLLTKRVYGGDYVHSDHHTIPLYDVEKGVYSKRIAQGSDLFSLYGWLDHMFSKSSNAAASVIMREALVSHILDVHYHCADHDTMEETIQHHGRVALGQLSEDLTNCALQSINISQDEFRLGGFFTSGAEQHVMRSGGSIGTTKGLLKFLYALETGTVISPEISLEIKRLMYLTDRRIRYAASHVLDQDAVYYKSGSLYSFKPEPGFVKKKYAGNRYNYMNSVAIIEKQDSAQTKYLVALMSNVLRKNSVGEHYALAGHVDRMIVGN